MTGGRDDRLSRAPGAHRRGDGATSPPTPIVQSAGCLVDVHTGTIRPRRGCRDQESSESPRSATSTTRAARRRVVIDADGAFLVPGLVDPHLASVAHVHKLNRLRPAANLHHGTTAVCRRLLRARHPDWRRAPLRFFLDELKATPVKALVRRSHRFATPRTAYLGLPVVSECANRSPTCSRCSTGKRRSASRRRGTSSSSSPEQRDLELLALPRGGAPEAGKVISGHGAGLPERPFRSTAYPRRRASRTTTSSSPRDEGASGRPSSGSSLLIREGASCSDIRQVAQAITADGPRSSCAFLLCPDVVTTEAMFDVGQQDKCIRVADRETGIDADASDPDVHDPAS